MRICVQGLGYAGLVSGVCLAREGHSVVGVDVDPLTAETIASGRSPMNEPRIAELVAEEVASGRLRVAGTCAEAVRSSELTMVCVGTPTGNDGMADLSQVERVCREIGAALAGSAAPHLVVIRSTVPPGTTRRMADLIALRSGLRLGERLRVAFQPEFLREGSSVADFRDPPYTVVGASDSRGAEQLRAVYSFLDAPFIVLEEEEAELLKYASNAFHAAKVAFCNEIGRIAAASGMNGRRIMEAFRRDRALNVSDAYLRPGLPYGGSCLSKDLEVLVLEARRSETRVPLLDSIAHSNDAQHELAMRLVEEAAADHPGEPIGFLGLAFKRDTDDLRNSPSLLLAEGLVRAGYEVRAFDDNVRLGRLHRANLAFLRESAPGVAERLSPTLGEVLGACRLLVVTNGYAERLLGLELAGDRHRLLHLEQALSGGDAFAIDEPESGAAAARGR